VRGGNDGLAIRSIDTGRTMASPQGAADARDPRFSPDGKSPVVGGRDGKGRDGVYRIDVETGNFTTICIQHSSEPILAGRPTARKSITKPEHQIAS
jgi:hypothetical protein